MTRLSTSHGPVPQVLSECVALARHQPLLFMPSPLPARRIQKWVGVLLVGGWVALFLYETGGGWWVAASGFAAAGTVLWPLMVWLERHINARGVDQLGCYFDFAQRMVYRTGGVVVKEQFAEQSYRGLYVVGVFDLNQDPDAWSIGAFDGSHVGEWYVELRHRSLGPRIRMLRIEPSTIPVFGAAHQVDELVDVLCQRLGVRRSGSYLRSKSRKLAQEKKRRLQRER